jgi:hypothetical protein
MDTFVLVDEKYDEGRRLVEELDKQGKKYPIILWTNDPEKNDWVLLFGISKLKEIGAKKIFTIIQSTIKEHNINISLNSVTLIDTTNQFCKDLKAMIRTGYQIGRISFFGNIINGRRLPDSIIYRVN